MIRFDCPHCGSHLKVEATAPGKKLVCPHCRKDVAIPVLVRPHNRHWAIIAAGAGILLSAAAIALAAGLLPMGSGPSAQTTGKTQPGATPTPLAVGGFKELTAAEVVAQNKGSVARVRHRFGTGSGFLARPDLIVTNYHVVSGDLVENIEVTFPSGERGSNALKTTLLYEDRNRDLAVLRVATPLKPLALSDCDGQLGEEVIVIGSPALADGVVAENTVTSGLLSNRTKLPNGHEYYQVSAPINPGNSGGPLFNRRGQVVGVATLSQSDKQAINFAVPWGEVKKALDKAEGHSAAEWERDAAEHDFVVVFRGVGKVGYLYAFLLDKYSQAIRSALKAGTDPDQALRQARQEWEGKVVQRVRELLTPIKPYRIRVSSDRTVPEAERRKFQDLWDLVVEAENRALKPKEKAGEYAEQNDGCVQKLRHVIDAIKQEVGVESLN